MTARLFFDEHVHPRIAATLVGDSRFDILTTQQAGRANQGLSDESQMAFATDADRLVFTLNIRDFSRIARQWGSEGRHHRGILWSRPAEASDLVARLRAWVEFFPDGLPDDMEMYLP